MEGRVLFKETSRCSFVMIGRVPFGLSAEFDPEPASPPAPEAVSLADAMPLAIKPN